MIAGRSVLFLIPTLRGGGAERVITTVLRHIDRSQFRLALAVVDTRGAVFRQELPDDVDFIDLGCRRVRYALPKIVALLWKRQPDVVFSTLGHLNLALAMLRPVLPRRSHYIARETAVVTDSIKAAGNPELWSWLYRRFYGRHDTVVCQSPHMQADLVQNFGLPVSKTVVIPNPVDVERIRSRAQEGIPVPPFPDRPGSIRLIAVGRLVETKGFDLLLQAFAGLPKGRFDLAILGEGPLLGQLRQQAVQLGISDRVHFAGYQANPYAHLAQADALVLSSRHEAFPNVVLEALACETPVIAVPAPGGTAAIIGQVPGCQLADEVSEIGLTRAILSWASQRDHTIDASAVAPYRVERVVREYASLFSGQTSKDAGLRGQCLAP